MLTQSLLKDDFSLAGFFAHRFTIHGGEAYAEWYQILKALSTIHLIIYVLSITKKMMGSNRLWRQENISVLHTTKKIYLNF